MLFTFSCFPKRCVCCFQFFNICLYLNFENWQFSNGRSFVYFSINQHSIFHIHRSAKYKYSTKKKQQPHTHSLTVYKLTKLNNNNTLSNMQCGWKRNRVFCHLIVWLTKSHKMRSLDIFCRSAYGDFSTWNERKTNSPITKKTAWKIGWKEMNEWVTAKLKRR